MDEVTEKSSANACCTGMIYVILIAIIYAMYMKTAVLVSCFCQTLTRMKHTCCVWRHFFVIFTVEDIESSRSWCDSVYCGPSH